MRPGRGADPGCRGRRALRTRHPARRAGGVALTAGAREVARDEAIHRPVPRGPDCCRRIDARQREWRLPGLRRRRRRRRGPRALVDPCTDQRDTAGLERVLVLGHRRLDGAGESIDQQAPAAGARTDRGATASAFEQVGRASPATARPCGSRHRGSPHRTRRGWAGSGSRNRWCRSRRGRHRDGRHRPQLATPAPPATAREAGRSPATARWRPPRRPGSWRTRVTLRVTSGSHGSRLTAQAQVTILRARRWRAAVVGPALRARRESVVVHQLPAMTR